MQSKPLTVWLKTCDPIHRGWTRWGIANGLCAMEGRSYARMAGGYNLYRSLGGVPDEHSDLVGAADAAAREIRTFPWVMHEAGRAYHYRVVPIGGGGVENWAEVTATRVVLDEAGDWIGSLPNAPTDLRVSARTAGRFAVQWTYLSQGQETAPAGFHLYTNAGGEGIDYGSVRYATPYIPGTVYYEVLTDAYPHGRRSDWAVRAYTVRGFEEQNMASAFAEARSEAPPINPTVDVSLV